MWMWKIVLQGHIIMMSTIADAFNYDFRNLLDFHFEHGEHHTSCWCGGTCKDWYLSLLSHTTRYLCDVI